MNREKTTEKNPIQGATEEGKRERSFELSLSALVSGRDALDREFEEETSVVSISSREAFIGLTSAVQPGTKLRISLQVPQTLYLEKGLMLAVSGTVAQVRPEPRLSSKRSVLVRLDRRFRIERN